MSLEDLEKQLYGQKAPSSKKEEVKSSSKKETSQDFSDVFLENPWEIKEVEKSEPSPLVSQNNLGRVIRWGRWLFWILIGVAVVLFGIAGFYLYQYFSVKETGLEIKAPSEALVGTSFTVAVVFENSSSKTLISPKLSLVLPEGIIYLEDESKRIIEKDLKEIAPSQIVKEEFEVALIGKPFQTYRFDSSLSYAYPSSALSNRFSKKASFLVLAREPVLSLDLTGPEKVLDGQEFEVSLRYQNQDSKPLSGIIEFQIPKEFSFQGSEPQLEKNQLILENLSPSQERAALISGFLSGEEYSYFPFGVVAKVKIKDKYYPIEEKQLSISLLPSPLSLKIELEGQNKDKIVFPGQNLNFRVSFNNEADINFSDVILEVELKGKMFNFSSLKTKGYFDDTQKKITWTATDLPLLKEIKARSGGSVSFSIGLLSSYPVESLADKNFTLQLKGKISSPTVPYNVVAPKTTGTAQAEYKVGGQIFLSQSAYFLEPSPDIVNQGSLPPKVGVPIQYTIHWDLETWATDFKDIKISSFLGTGVKWTGKVKTNISTVPVYNPRTQEITWEIPLIEANKGVVEKSPQAVFQVEFVPSSLNLDNRFIIVSKTNLSATDAFTEKVSEISLKSLDSRELSDSDLPPKYDRVIP
ncbi:MAG: hypothetical protein KatS3mg098_093 [Candidatus Parcubacteria bacterium]|nr:hypothetical protein [Patescibacteria group bacterium]BCX15864.1 MAG: hypothetical protein KatS3mg098_093 [Candidatus Parcubacteria bacterium]